MLSKELFLERYLDLHDRIIPNIIEAQSEEVLTTTKNGVSSILWTYWHMIRTEDVGVCRFILNEPQVYEAFFDIVNVKTTLNGTGMSLDQVSELTTLINLDGLKKYREAVKNKTIDQVNSYDHIDLSKSPSKTHIKKVICKEKTMPESSWDMLPLYYDKPKEWFLLHVSLTHRFYNLGQISTMLKPSEKH